MGINRFPLTSDDCELLLEFENSGSIEKTAYAVFKDASGVSRQFAKIMEKYPALEKRAGRWVLTEIGKRLNSCTRDAIQIQQQLMSMQPVLRIGTNREFAARVMGPNFIQLAKLFPRTQIMLLALEHGTEEALLAGKIDIGIDCDRPLDPDIAYKLYIDEPIVAVCTKEFRKKYENEIASHHLYRTPHLLCERLYPDKIFSEKDNDLNVVAMFNDIATARAACLTGYGWSLLPRYAVRREIDKGRLVVISEKTLGKSKYGVWWLRSRTSQKDAVQILSGWLKLQKL